MSLHSPVAATYASLRSWRRSMCISTGHWLWPFAVSAAEGVLCGLGGADGKQHWEGLAGGTVWAQTVHSSLENTAGQLRPRSGQYTKGSWLTGEHCRTASAALRSVHKGFMAHWRTLQDSFGRAQVSTQRVHGSLENTAGQLRLRSGQYTKGSRLTGEHCRIASAALRSVTWNPVNQEVILIIQVNTEQSRYILSNSCASRSIFFLFICLFSKIVDGKASQWQTKSTYKTLNTNTNSKH